jgi:uncharacterized protein (AIM24 family)
MNHPLPLRADVGPTTFGSLSYQIAGELVPVLDIELGNERIYFEHHILLWKDPAVAVGVKTLKGAFKRLIAGMAIFMTEAHGRGRIAFSRDGAGQVFPIHLARGDEIEVREHQFLAATEAVEFTFIRVQGMANMLLGGTGFFIDRFSCPRDPGVLWLHGYGNVFEAVLGPGEQLDVEPGAWIYKDRTVAMETQFQRLSTGLFASAGQFTWNRFTGPGRVGIQSMALGFASDA